MIATDDPFVTFYKELKAINPLPSNPAACSNLIELGT